MFQYEKRNGYWVLLCGMNVIAKRRNLRDIRYIADYLKIENESKGES